MPPFHVLPERLCFVIGYWIINCVLKRCVNIFVSVFLGPKGHICNLKCTNYVLIIGEMWEMLRIWTQLTLLFEMFLQYMFCTLLRFWCRIRLWFRYVGGFVMKVDDVTAYLAAQPSCLSAHHRNITTTRWRLCVTILHLQQYSRRLNLFLFSLTLILLMWRIGWAHNNARK